MKKTKLVSILCVIALLGLFVVPMVGCEEIEITPEMEELIREELAKLEGPQGEPGPAGPQGEPGPAGLSGPQGEQGLQGERGSAGPAGSQGSQGEQGPQGEVGPAGSPGSTGATGATGPPGSAAPFISLVPYGNGVARWSTGQVKSGNYSVYLEAGTIGGANAGRIEMIVASTPIADFTGATYFVWEPTGTAHGGQYPAVTGDPYGDPYINILLDTDGDGVWDDKLEGLGSITVGSTPSPATHPTPTAETWVQMEDGYGFYDMNNSMGQGTWIAWPIVVGTLAEWKAWLATNKPDCMVLGVQITFGFWADDPVMGVYVDDVTINSITYQLGY